MKPCEWKWLPRQSWSSEATFLWFVSSVLVNVLQALENNLYFYSNWTLYCTYVNYDSLVEFSILTIFYPLILSVNEKGVLKFPTIIVDFCLSVLQLLLYLF